MFYVPCPHIECARDIARTLLQEKLIACGNILPQMQSLYVWEGKIEENPEVLLILKTSSGVDKTALEKRLASLHPYSVPAIIKLEASCNAPFQEWLEVSTR